MVTNSQRALWTFLIYALVAPFLAAVAVTGGVVLARMTGIGSLVPEAVTGIGEAALATFVWSAVPAVITALILAVIVWRSGALTWIAAAVVAVIAFAAVSLLLPLELHEARAFLGFLAGLVSIAVRQVLIQADILPD